jgi:uncharacterized protein YbbC (DUF1343 family)
LKNQQNTALVELWNQWHTLESPPSNRCEQHLNVAIALEFWIAMTTDKIGLERLNEPDIQAKMGNRKIGLLINQASVDRQLNFAVDIVRQRFPNQLRCVFSPQHGIWGEQQANMLETPHGRLDSLGIPVYSLYSETRRPKPHMIGDIDCIIIDLQDVGTRVYTFIWTMLEVLRACEAENKTVVVLDRPNPIGGEVFEGPPLQDNYLSFVGGASIPLRHGLTMAELALLFRDELNIKVDLQVVPMTGWTRNQSFSATGRHWLWPSPNMPTLTTTQLYPGQVLLEGCNLSEGRGTTRPFELIGATFIDARRWLNSLDEFPMPGVRLLPTRFQPTFDKWNGQSCQGLDIQIVDSSQVRSVGVTVSLLATAAKLFPEFAWLEPPYEYEYHKPPIDILFGSDQLRQSISQFASGQSSSSQLLKVIDWDQTSWQSRIAPYLLY